MKISLILKGKADQFGRQPLVLLTSDLQKRNSKRTGIWLTAEQFNRFKKGEPRSNEKDLYKRFLGAADVKEESKYPDHDFKQYAYQCLREWNKTKKGSTIYQFKGDIDRFIEFAGNRQLSNITVQTLNEYKVHLLKERTNNTAWKTFKHLKTIFNKAVKERIIEHSPFFQFENIKYKNPHKKFLTKEQIQVLEDYCKQDIPDRIKFVATWFLLSCYTGLRFSDTKQFGKHLIKHNRLILYTTKTNEPVSLPLNDKLKALFEQVHYKQVDITNQKMNEYLKVISEATQLPALNFHMSRHTFGAACARNKVSKEVTAKFMGITNMKTVAIYYSLTSDRMDDEYNNLF